MLVEINTLIELGWALLINVVIVAAALGMSAILMFIFGLLILIPIWLIQSALGKKTEYGLNQESTRQGSCQSKI